MSVTIYLFLVAPILYVDSYPAQTDRATLSMVVDLRDQRSHGKLHLPMQAYWKTQKTLAQVKEAPWRCFAKTENGQVCSCTIISKDFVLAKSSCIQNPTQSIQVHAGATNETNAEQIVGAAVLEAPEPTPLGIVGIKLTTGLKFSRRVSNIKMIKRNHDNHFGFVSGFGYTNGTYELGVSEAGIFEAECTVGLCVVGNRWPQLTDYPSKATDFLDYYDEQDQVFYFIGVLDEHSGRNFAVYHKIKDIIDWIKKYLGGCAVKHALRH